MKPERQAASAEGVCRRKGGAGRGVSPVLHKRSAEEWGYGLRRLSRPLRW